jgi:ribonuclease D
VAGREEGWLVDPLVLSKQDLGPLLDVLTDPGILKVAHAIAQDQECLYHDFGVLAAPTLDTSIAAALTGRGDQLGLAPLLSKLLGVSVPKGHTRTDWLKRPLPPAMAKYALSDVTHLVRAGEILLDDLDRLGRREWAMALSAEFADAARYEANPDQIARKLATGKRMDSLDYAVLRELIGWREARVRRADLPRRWVAEDAVLVKLAQARPTEQEDLSHFRGLGAKLLAREGDAILAAIGRGLDLPPEERHAPPRQPGAEREEAPAVAVLKCFIQVLAREHCVPARYLIDPDRTVELLRRRFSTLEELRASNLLKPPAVDLFGKELLDILRGEQTLRLRGSRIEWSRPDLSQETVPVPSDGPNEERS